MYIISSFICTVFIEISAQGAYINHFGCPLIVSIFVARINPKIYYFGHFQANSQSYWTHYKCMLVSWIDLGRWLIILWFIASKNDGWALIGAWATIRMNTVIKFHTKILHISRHAWFILRGYCTSGPYFWSLCVFSQKIR